MNEKEAQSILRSLKKKYNVRMYTPFKYFQGLQTPKQIESRFLQMRRKTYDPFLTDAGKKTKTSRYTQLFQSRFGHGHLTLESKSQVTGVPLEIIKTVYRKGQAAWRTGHRVGATENQWAYARVHSFLTLGCTAFTSDFTLLMDAMRQMDFHKSKKWLQQDISCEDFEKSERRRLNKQEFLERREKILRTL